MRTILALLLTVLGVSAQNVTMRQVTNYAVGMLDGKATNVTTYENIYLGGSSMRFSFGAGYAGLFDTSTTYWLATPGGVVLGDVLDSIPTYIHGNSIILHAAETTNSGNLRVLGTAYDANNFQYVTTLQASNNVRIAAGSGISVAAAETAANVMTYTITDTSGLGATNAVGVLNTNGSLLGAGMTALTISNSTDIVVTGISNNNNGIVAVALNPAVRTDLTNYAASVGLGATNLAYAIGANDTNYINSRAVNLTNAINALGVAGTNNVNALGVAVTNAIGAEGAKSTNYTLATAASLQTIINNQGTAVTNLIATKQDGSTVLTELANSGIRFPNGPLASNVNQILYTVQTIRMPTNSATSNLVVNVRTNKYFITATNNFTLTNFTGIADGIGADTTIIVLPQLINRGVGYPTFGGASYGIYARTNSTMWNTLTANVAYAISISAFGTNTFWAITEWK